MPVTRVSCNFVRSLFHSIFHSIVPFHIPVQRLETPWIAWRLYFLTVRYNGLDHTTQKLDAIKEAEKTHIQPYLRATKWHLESSWMWQNCRFLHTWACVKLVYCISNLSPYYNRLSKHLWGVTTTTLQRFWDVVEHATNWLLNHRVVTLVADKLRRLWLRFGVRN